MCCTWTMKFTNTLKFIYPYNAKCVQSDADTR